MSSDRLKPKPFPGTDVDIHWDGRLCIHVGECVHARGDLFVAGRKPWAEPDSVTADEVARVVSRCPSGALTYRRKDGGPDEAPSAVNTVTVSNDGPLYVQGDLHIAGAPDTMEGVTFRAALCRCGQSSNKPFCDGSHGKAGFRDTGAVGIEGPGISGETAALEITPSENGPLLFKGPLSIHAGSGRKAWQGEKCALCRCGLSNNKPFCDGSHRAGGFQAAGS
jgi:CDGSH-type Zn-finger protein/uncharacterized Fe-S cluster protein YjdI